jgi:15-cis-phytoene synthase
MTANALAASDAVLREKGRSFHWARRLLGASHAERATRLYGLCRYIDDLADEGESAELAEAQLMRVAADIRSGVSLDPVLADGLELMRECAIEPAVLLALVAGVSTDLHTVRLPDLDALLQYGFRVAGTVGLMMCRVLDTHDARAMAHAVDLGIAMQITNICRDVAADALVGRRYLPASMVGELDPQLLVRPDAALQPVVKACIKTLLARAELHYQSAEIGLPYLPLGARTGILAAARVYRAIGLELLGRDCDYWTERVVVTQRRKLGVTAELVVTQPFQRSFWRLPRGHDAQLHSALNGVFSGASGACLA